LRILFLVHAPSRVRHFVPVLAGLAERGHSVRIAAVERKGGINLPQPLARHRRVSTTACPTRRADGWSSFAGQLRVARDYARYLHPRYRNAEQLRGRASIKARKRGDLGLARFHKHHQWIGRFWWPIERALALAEQLVPSDRAFETFLKAERPDIVLVTPLVDFGSSYQTDYIKSAHSLGLPIGFLPFSWDNLSNKGHVRAQPDRILVWNVTQRWEAMELHGIPAERVVVTGAPRFDQFFSMKPSTDRRKFCKMVGLDPSEPFILYLCSSEFVTPREVEFVRRWVQEIRQSGDLQLRRCGVLVRPHPAHRAQWQAEDLSDLANVSLWRTDMTNMGDRGLYDSLYHAETVVGLNTSAQIEAGILGKSVHTLLVPEFKGGQEGTLHFDYLLRANGGLVTLARDFPEHREQLAAALRRDPSNHRRAEQFIQGFVRPHGLAVPATPIMVREIERLAEIRKLPRRRAPLWHYPLRWFLLRSLRSMANGRPAKQRPLAQPTAASGQAR
jgi:hypothetical protein